MVTFIQQREQISVFSKASNIDFFSCSLINWRRLILLLSQRVIHKVSSLSDSDRKVCFVIYDSILQRNKGKEVELMGSL